MLPPGHSRVPTAILTMSRSFAALVPTFAILLTAHVAGAQEAPSTRPDTAAAASPRAAPTSDSVGSGSARARQLGAVEVVAKRARRAGYLVTSSRTAMKTDTPLRDTPQSATVLTERFIADQAMQSMAAVVRFI